MADNQAIIADAVKAGLTQATTNKNVDLQHGDIARIAADVVPVVVNAVNAEPMYQSRVIVGTVVAILSLVAKFAGHELDLIDQNSLTDLIMQVVTLAGSAYALYGRLTSGLKPIGA